jgi:hypothetical protein
MSLFGRLFGAKPLPEAPNTVVIDPELASQLTASGMPLDRAVHQALSTHLASLSATAQPAAGAQATAGAPAAVESKSAERKDNERVPFWLQRDDDKDTALEEQLRDRIINRRETETDRQT